MTGKRYGEKMVLYPRGYAPKSLLAFARRQGYTVNRKGQTKYVLSLGIRKCLEACYLAGGVAEVMRLIGEKNSKV